MKKGCLFVFLIIGGLFAVFFFKAIIDGSSNAAGSPGGDKHGAWAYAQLFVEKELKSPKTAEFPSNGSRFVTPLGDGRFQVEAYVDAENSFGANVRTEFTAVLEKVEEGWKLVSLEVD